MRIPWLFLRGYRVHGDQGSGGDRPEARAQRAGRGFAAPPEESVFFRHDRSQADGLIAAVHEQHIAGYAGGQIRGQKKGGITDLINGHITAQGREFFNVVKDNAEVRDARRGQGLDRPGADGIDAYALLAEVRGKEASSAALATPMTL